MLRMFVAILDGKYYELIENKTGELKGLFEVILTVLEN
jgi:hypothetical protein